MLSSGVGERLFVSGEEEDAGQHAHQPDAFQQDRGELLAWSLLEVNGATVIGGRIQTQPGGELSGDVFHIAGQWPDIATWQPWGREAAGLAALQRSAARRGPRLSGARTGLTR